MANRRIAKDGFLALLVLATLVTGCGHDSGRPPNTTTAPTGGGSVADSPAQLPKRWTLHANGPSGFTVGVPPDWAVAEHGEASLLFSPGRLVVVSITADRTDEALRAPLSDLTNETARHLSGFNEVVPTAVAGFAGRYPGAELTATATRTSGERQRLTLIVMRGGGAVFSLLAAATDRLKPAVGRTIGGKIARTLRYRPVEVTS